MNDQELLLAIQQELDGTEWNSDTLERIATMMIKSGYRIRDVDDVDRDENGNVIPSNPYID